MAKKYVPVHKSIDELTTAEVIAWLGKLPDNMVLRSILVAEIKAVQAGQPREERTMRGLWYDVVKPLLSRAGLLNKATRNGKPIEWDRRLSEVLTDLVRAGHTSYEELRIVDGSRQRQAAAVLSHSFVDVNMVGGHYPWIILFTEKDTIWGVLQSLASMYGISALSGGGQPSNACTENTIREIVRSEAFQKAQPGQLELLTMSDYDPSGEIIANAQYAQIIEAVKAMPMQERRCLENVSIRRLGIFPTQLTAEERAVKAYEPKPKGLEAWFKKTGGVDGQRLGLELDALPLSQLRGIFVRAIEQLIDLEPRRQDLREAYIDLLACELLLPEFEARRAAMLAAVKNNGLWQEITEAIIPANLFSMYAVHGHDWISPDATRKLFEAFTERAKAAMLAPPNEKA